MRRNIMTSILALGCVTIVAGQTTQNTTPKTGNLLAAKLREDLAKAVQNSDLNEAQRDVLQTAVSKLRSAAEVKQNGGTVDRDALKSAFADIKKIAESDAFRPEDQAAVKADIEAIEKAAQEAGKKVSREEIKKKRGQVKKVRQRLQGGTV